MNPLELVFGGSIAFFVIALVVSGLLFFGGNNTISTKNVDVAVNGPTEIGAGATLPLNIVITNRNAVPMELADLVVEFPPGTRSDTDVSVNLPRTRQSIGTIQPGESINRTIRAVMFAAAGSDVVVKVSVEYRIASSNAVFVSDATYTAKINQAPASITVDALKEAVSGQDVTFKVSVTSNSPLPLKDMLLLATYPPGFTFTSASPVPVAGSAAWGLGDIEPGGTRSISVTGHFVGEDGDQKVMQFSAGNKQSGTDAAIAAPLAATDMTLTVTKPFVSVALALGGEVTAEHTVQRGDDIRGDIRWTNNLPVAVQNLEIELSFKGQILDRTTVSPQRGFFRSVDQTALWNTETDPRLSTIGPGESGVASFSFKTLPQSQGTFRNPALDLTVTVRARRLSESNVPDTVSSSATAQVLVSTDLSLLSSLSRSGPFTNTGPVPPKADTETTYTVSWTAANTANAVADASASAVLPTYVRWKNAVSPDGSGITFNPVGGIVTWDIGDIAAGASKTVMFQVAITPSVSQVGSAPTVVGDERVYGFDRFTRGKIENTTPSLTTASASVSQGSGTVVP